MLDENRPNEYKRKKKKKGFETAIQEWDRGVLREGFELKRDPYHNLFLIIDSLKNEIKS